VGAKSNMRRSRYQIISQILEICSGGASKTQIVYRVNLNFKTVNPYIDLLINNGLLSVKHEQDREYNREYKTTEKGLEFYDRLRDMNNGLLKI
jgi:predicted transcriptional regulator